MNASSDLAISLMSYPTKAASCSLVKSVRGCLCKNTSKSRSQALRTTGVRARRCATSVAPALDGFEVEIEPPPRWNPGQAITSYTTAAPRKTVVYATFRSVAPWKGNSGAEKFGKKTSAECSSPRPFGLVRNVPRVVRTQYRLDFVDKILRVGLW